MLERKLIFDKAIALREEGKYGEAIDVFLGLAKSTDNAFEKAGMLLNATHTFRAAGELDFARSQLKNARELLALPQYAALAGVDEENRRRLTIWADLEDARISAAQNELQEAIAKLENILSNYQSELRNPGFCELFWETRRDRGFLLADSGSHQEALLVLEEVDAAEPHDRWTLFYLGYCYFCSRKFAEAKRRLEEAIELGLTPDFDARAHCTLGASYYELGDYVIAKSELEKGVKTASPRYLKEAGIWQWLEYTCIRLGLRAEAEKYGELARSCTS